MGGERVASVVGNVHLLAELEVMAQRSRRVLEDPKKKRWHDDMRRQLEQIEAEMARLKSAAAP